MKAMGTRPRGRPKMGSLDRLKSDMGIYGINPEMATDRERWAVMVKNVDTNFRSVSMFSSGLAMFLELEKHKISIL